MNFWGSFWDIIWFFFWGFVFVSYLFALFAVVTDIFRDRSMNGWLKALWVVCLVFVPFLTVLVYVIWRGKDMAARDTSDRELMQSQADEYIREVAVSSPADEIRKAKALYDAGTINRDEFDLLKARVLNAPSGAARPQPVG
jgi:hypothetical protein